MTHLDFADFAANTPMDELPTVVMSRTPRAFPAAAKTDEHTVVDIECPEPLPEERTMTAEIIAPRPARPVSSTPAAKAKAPLTKAPTPQAKPAAQQAKVPAPHMKAPAQPPRPTATVPRPRSASTPPPLPGSVATKPTTPSFATAPALPASPKAPLAPKRHAPLQARA